MKYIVAVTDLGIVARVIIHRDHLGDLVYLVNIFGDLTSISKN